jgi:CDP-diacylglycerol--serine O-phosphatidyltransferase
MPTSSSPRPFSLIRDFHLADWFTLANALCGTGAVFAMMSFLETGAVRQVYLAGSLALAALLFDIVDGRIARWRHTASAMGRELDSLADVISFGVAPAAIAYGCGMRTLADCLVLAIFVACGVSRLARYNITTEAMSEGGDKVRHFEGTPIPTSLALVAMLLLATWRGAVGEGLWLGEIGAGALALHPLVLVFAASGALMVSRIRIPKL